MMKSLVAVLVAGVLLAGCGDKDAGGSSSGGSTNSGGSSARAAEPKDVFLAAKAAVKSGDGKAMWALFSKKSKESMAKQMGPMFEMIRKDENQLGEVAKESGVSADKLKAMNDMDLLETYMIANFKKMANDPDEVKKMEKTEWVSSEIKGEQAFCVTKEPKEDGAMKDDYMVLVKEDGAWKLDMEATDAYKKEKSGGGK